MKKILFIVNPVAGKKRRQSLVENINRLCTEGDYVYQITYTQYAGHGTELAKKAAQQNFDIVAVAGGDGSINEVLQGIYDTSTLLAILPVGSGNGIARSLKIPLNPARAIRLLREGSVRRIDVGAANGRLFLGTAGVGFDALVTKKFQNDACRGFCTYINLILKHLYSYKPQTWSIEVDGKREETRVFMATVANALQLGYGFYLAPRARMDDGRLEFVQIRETSSCRLMILGVSAFLRLLQTSRKVRSRPVREVRIYKNGEFYIQLDGEAIPCDSSVHIRLMPEKLRVIV